MTAWPAATTLSWLFVLFPRGRVNPGGMAMLFALETQLWVPLSKQGSTHGKRLPHVSNKEVVPLHSLATASYEQRSYHVWHSSETTPIKRGNTGFM